MRKLVFEKVGDIASVYPYFCVYRDGDRQPFMAYGVTDDKQIQFAFYRGESDSTLDLAEWDAIRARAVEFLPRALAEEDAAEDSQGDFIG